MSQMPAGVRSALATGRPPGAGRPPADGPASPRPVPAVAPAAAATPLRHALAALLLPLSLVPVVLLAPSLARAPATLYEHAARALAPAHAAPRVVPREPGTPYYLDGPSRVELDVLGEAGAFTPKLGYSPLAEPTWAASAALGAGVAGQPSVLIARGRETTTASGQPLR